MYSLQKYAGPASRHVCPGCGRKSCFTLYVDENGEKLDDSVGKCDHVSSCAYHYTPRQFFADHPERKPGGEDWREAPDWLKRRNAHAPEHPKPLCTISPEIVELAVRPGRVSDLVVYLLSILDPLIVEGLVDDYRLGATRSGDVIFFEIDAEGRCRTGKIMKYNPETGHRIKDESMPGRVTWVHSLLKNPALTPPRWLLPPEWELSQCLFGEHLLARYPEKTVALVESEKTAVICAGLMPGHLWLATGGKTQINDRLLVLQGRRIVAYPDIDGYEEWAKKLSEYPSLGVTISPLLSQNATAEDVEAHIDIADWLLRHRAGDQAPPTRRRNPTFLKVARYFSPEIHSELEALIEELDLITFMA